MIGGYTAPKGTRVGFGALLVGYHDGDGTSLRRQGRHRVRHPDPARPAGCNGSNATGPPFTRGRVREADVHWVEPELVAQIGFTEWTRGRHAPASALQRTATDKAAADVVREIP